MTKLRRSLAVLAVSLISLPAVAFAGFERPSAMMSNIPAPLPDLMLTFSDGVNLPKSSFTLTDSEKPSRPDPGAAAQRQWH